MIQVKILNKFSKYVLCLQTFHTKYRVDFFHSTEVFRGESKLNVLKKNCSVRKNMDYIWLNMLFFVKILSHLSKRDFSCNLLLKISTLIQVKIVYKLSFISTSDLSSKRIP